MSEPKKATLALLMVGLVLLVFLGGTFLPFFIDRVWGPLWGVEWWPPGVSRSFGRVEPFCGLSPWAALLAVPLSSLFVLTFFVITVGVSLLLWRRGH